jgi:hypothetical protein
VSASQAKPLSQLLLLAEPLMREGLLRLLGEGAPATDADRSPGGPASYRLACGAGAPPSGAGFGLLTTYPGAGVPAGARASGLLVGRPGLKP